MYIYVLIYRWLLFAVIYCCLLSFTVICCRFLSLIASCCLLFPLTIGRCHSEFAFIGYADILFAV